MPAPQMDPWTLAVGSLSQVTSPPCSALPFSWAPSGPNSADQDCGQRPYASRLAMSSCSILAAHGGQYGPHARQFVWVWRGRSHEELHSSGNSLRYDVQAPGSLSQNRHPHSRHFSRRPGSAKMRRHHDTLSTVPRAAGASRPIPSCALVHASFPGRIQSGVILGRMDSNDSRSERKREAQQCPPGPVSRQTTPSAAGS